MEILDEQGRLFGRVNVVDALVVVFAVAVVVAGAALVLADDPEPEEPDPDESTMHVTFATSSFGAAELEPGPVWVDGGEANVTDVHATAGPRFFVRVALDGTELDGRFEFDGKPVRLGDRYTVYTNTTRADAALEQRDVSASFETSTTTATIEMIVRPGIADAVEVGDEHRVADSRIARVTDVESRPADDPDVDDGRTLTVTLELETRTVDGVLHYGGRPLQLGRLVEFETDEYRIEGEVVRRG